MEINSAGQSPSWEANNSVTKKFPTIMEPEYSLPYLQEPATGSYPEPDEPLHTLPPYFL
jgi:hypothetical protein